MKRVETSNMKVIERKTMKQNLIWLVALSALLLVVGNAGATALPYTTGFESSDSFTPGSVNGQGGWSADGISVASVTTAAAHTGTQSLLFNPTVGDGNV